MQSVIQRVEAKYKKHAVVDVRSGDVVRIHQRIKEGNKQRIQVFEGLVMRVQRSGSLSQRVLVRRIASGIGVEKSYLLHSPLISKVEVVKRGKVRRNYLTYMRARTGKLARISGVEFDRQAVNTIREDPNLAPPAEPPAAEPEKTDETAAEPEIATEESDLPAVK